MTYDRTSTIPDYQKASSAPLWDDGMVRERLAHYQQAAEKARSELAALQAKHQSIQAQLQDVLSRLASRDAAVQELREELEGYKESGARQASLVGTLRERLQDAEQDAGGLASSKSRLDAALQELANENRVLKRRVLELESQSQEHLSGWNKTKREASDTKRTYQAFVSKLATSLAVDLGGRKDPLEYILSQVDALCERSEGQRGKIHTLEESIQALEVECRASRETVMRLVAEVSRERGVASTRAKEVESLRQELNSTLLAKRNEEKENQSLQDRLHASQRALAATKQELDRMERRSLELDGHLAGTQIKAQSLQAREQAFREELATLLGGKLATAPPTEEDLWEQLKEMCSREKSSRAALLEMQAKASQMSEKLAEQEQLHQVALQRSQLAEQHGRELGARLRGLEVELLSGEVLQDGLRHNRQHHERFLEQLSEKMKLGGVTADLGFDMRLEAILSRAEQLVKQEGAALVETRTLAHSLQRKMKAQKERLESKELHTDLLRRKVAQLEEEKRARSALAVERDDAHLAARKLQKKTERLQKELESLRHSNTELKAQLADTHGLKIKVMEQKQTITEQNKSLGELEKGKESAEKKLTTAKAEFQTKVLRAIEDQQQAQILLESHSNELRTLRQTLAELSKTERQLANFRKVVSEMLGLDASMLAIPDYEIIKRLEWLLHPYHHHYHPHHHASDAPSAYPPQQHHQKDPTAESATMENDPNTALKALPAPSEASP
ncbi:coiled-coil domain-containing protein 170 isoform X2 [Anguilla rostrata]